LIIFEEFMFARIRGYVIVFRTSGIGTCYVPRTLLIIYF